MRRAAAVLLMVMALGTALEAGVRPVGACSCLPLDIDANVADAEAIVIGTVTSVDADYSGGQVDFAVDRYVTGSGAGAIKIRAGQGSDCSLFTQGTTVDSRWLVALFRWSDGAYGAGSCSIYATGDQDIAAMIAEIESSPNLPTDDGGNTPWIAIAVLVAGLGITSAVVVITRARAARGSE